jgi:hypothetical protein
VCHLEKGSLLETQRAVIFAGCKNLVSPVDLERRPMNIVVPASFVMLTAIFIAALVPGLCSIGLLALIRDRH